MGTSDRDSSTVADTTLNHAGTTSHYIETSNPQPAPEHVDILLMMKMLYMWTQRIGEVERVVLTAA